MVCVINLSPSILKVVECSHQITPSNLPRRVILIHLCLHSPLPQMVVNMPSAHNNVSEVKNISAYYVNVVPFEPAIITDPLVDELTNPNRDIEAYHTI